MIEPIQITWPVILGGVGGLLGSARSTVYAVENGSIWKAAINISIGVSCGAALCGHFVVDVQQPWIALPLGVSTGASGGYVLDAIQATMPSIAKQGLRQWFRRFLGLPVEDERNG